jgi:hypothetical protein
LNRTIPRLLACEDLIAGRHTPEMAVPSFRLSAEFYLSMLIIG